MTAFTGRSFSIDLYSHLCNRILQLLFAIELSRRRRIKGSKDQILIESIILSADQCRHVLCDVQR